jgi:hypothetical protein
MAGKGKKLSKSAWLLGLGLDNDDGHTRVTSGENFKLIGGSEETHGTMQEKAIRMNEQLKKRGKKLNELSREEFDEIAHKVGMRILDLEPSRPKQPKKK